MLTFYEMGLSSQVVRATSEMGFEETTPIQEKTIPLAIQGKNVIGQAQTGTGKTAAFGIPIIEQIDDHDRNVKALIVTPTRELAVQVAEEINRLGQIKEVKSLPIYGGQDINRQIRALKKNPQVIVGTPGRLIDHINRRTIRLDKIEHVVLDEADEMLNMGFIEDIETILETVPDERQTMLFSATIPKTIQDLSKRFIKDPEIVKIQPKEVTVPNIDQNYIEVTEKQKFDVLCRLLDVQLPDKAIVFGRTKRRVDELCEGLNKRGYSAEGIHGDFPQSQRNNVMSNFKNGYTEVLVATDVASRGLDISDVSHVYNFDIPQDSEGYVHRIGRTGRIGRSGKSITFVTPREIGHLKMIAKAVKSDIKKNSVPTMDEAIEGQQRITVEKLIQVIQNNNLQRHKKMAEELLEEYDSVTLLSAALNMLTKDIDTTPVKLTEEPAQGSRKFTQRQKSTRGGQKDHRRPKSSGRNHYKDGKKGHKKSRQTKSKG